MAAAASRSSSAPHTSAECAQDLLRPRQDPRSLSVPASDAARTSSPSSRQDDTREDDEDTVLTRFLVAPLTFISFLISLALIDRRNRGYRSSLHDPPSSFLAKIPILGRLVRIWWPTEPYAQQRGRRVVQVEQQDKRPRRAPEQNEKDVWTWRAKHRRMMRLEVSEALELRTEIVAGLVVGGLLALVGLLVIIREAWRYVAKAITG